MSAPIDHLTHNRLAVSAALRRLADTALAAAEQYTTADTVSDETAVIERVLGRTESVKHAVVIVQATRTGIARARTPRSAVA